MHYAIILAIILTVISTDGTAQPPVAWMRMYDINQYEKFYDIYATADGGYAMCGWVSADGSMMHAGNIWQLRIDDEGNQLWSGTYGFEDVSNGALSLIEIDDGGFLAGGWSLLNNSWIFIALRTDRDGEEVWLRNYGRSMCQAVIELKSGEFVLAGGGYFGLGGIVICIDGDGDVLWETHVEGPSFSGFRAMRETEGGIVLCGKYNYSANYHYLWVAKVDFDGELLWERRYEDFDVSQQGFTMVSAHDGGFLLGGIAGHPADDWESDFLLVKVDNEGQLQWFQTYNWHVGLIDPDYQYCRSLVKFGDDGYALAGAAHDGGAPTHSIPAIIQVDNDGVEVWRGMWDFAVDEDFGVYNPLSGGVQGHDNSIIVCGQLHHLPSDPSHNAFIMKLEPVILEPVIFGYSPQDTMLTVLPGDSINFEVHARDQFGNEMTYLWVMGEDTLATDTTTTVVFEEMGNFEVQCQVSNDFASSSITWHVTVTDFFLRSCTPDSLELTVRRGTPVDFSVEVAAVEGPQVDYLWTLTHRNQRQEEVGTADSVSITFDQSGEHSLGALVMRENVFAEVNWTIDVRSAIWSWWPSELDLSAYKDSTLEFAITPFNEDSDSLEYVWLLDGELLDCDSASVLVMFPEVGQSELTSIVHDGIEADTIRWTVNVEEWSFTADEADLTDLPTSPTLYPANPNPFNSSVKLSMYLPKADHVSLSVFDVNGREVSRLVDGGVGAGNQTFVWDANGFPAGVYVVRMEAGDAMEMRKVVLVR